MCLYSIGWQNPSAADTLWVKLHIVLLISAKLWRNNFDKLQELWTVQEQEEELPVHWKHINSKGVVCWQEVDITFEKLARRVPASEAFAVPMSLAPDLVRKLADIVLNKVGNDLLLWPFPFTK